MSESQTVRVQGVIVLVQLEDGSIRQAKITQVEHMRTILNICSMNEKKGLILGSEDVSEALTPYLYEEPLTEEDGSPDPDDPK